MLLFFDESLCQQLGFLLEEVIREKVTDANTLRDMIFFGKRFTPQEGKERGFVDEVVAPESLLETCVSLGKSVRAKASNRQAYQALKNNMYYRTTAALLLPVDQRSKL